MEKTIKQIQDFVKSYIIENQIKSLVIGISGGIDSTVNAAMLRPVCDELQIPMHGLYIHIESNKPIELASANLVGNAFCDSFETIDLTSEYHEFMSHIIKEEDDDTLHSHDFAIRCGNVKARMRMMKLRDLTQKRRGLMVDNSNRTERNLGFFTVSDNGDISPMMHLWKTDVYNIALHLSKMYDEIDAKKSQAINFSISLVPTDGLGISSSDLEQIGAESYEQVDNILKLLTLYETVDDFTWNETYVMLSEKYTKEIVDNVWQRHLKSQYKRNNLPIRMPND